MILVIYITYKILLLGMLLYLNIHNTYALLLRQ